MLGGCPPVLSSQAPREAGLCRSERGWRVRGPTGDIRSPWPCSSAGESVREAASDKELMALSEALTLEGVG